MGRIRDLADGVSLVLRRASLVLALIGGAAVAVTIAAIADTVAAVKGGHCG